MAIQYPSYAIPQPGNLLGSIEDGYKFGTQVQGDVRNQAATLAQLAEAAQLGNRAQPPRQPQQSLAALAPAQQPSIGPDGHPVAVGDVAAELNGQSNPYAQNVAQAESGGNPNAVNPTTGATGTYQFLPSTWQDLMQRHPELGLTADGMTDPAQQQKAMPVFTAENARTLASNGIAPSPGSLYAAHFLGGEGASQVLSAPDTTPIAQIAPAAAQANPNIAQMNVGQFRQWASQQGTGGNGGYQPPAAAPTNGTQPYGLANGIPQGAGLPDRDTLLALLRAPDTRQAAIQMIATAQQAQTPAGQLALAEDAKKAAMPNTLNPGETELDAAGHPVYTAPNVNRVSYSQATPADLAANGISNGDATQYQMGSNGKLIAIPGALGSTGSNGKTLGTTGAAAIDPTLPGYSSDIVTGGLTQAAIDQKALGYLTAGTPPPQGRTGIAGAQNVAIANRMAEMDPNGNLAANKSQLKSLTQSLATQQKYLDTTQRSVANAENGFAQVVQTFQDKGINTSQFPTINAMVNAVKAQLSPGDLAAYQAGLTEVGNEYAQVFARGGQVSDAVRSRAASIANGDLSISDLNKVLTELHAQGDIVVQGSQSQVKQISDQINSIVSPAAAASASTAAPAAAPAPQTAAPAAVPSSKTINGVTYTRDASGDWYQQ